jgi:hypothetical protein
MGSSSPTAHRALASINNNVIDIEGTVNIGIEGIDNIERIGIACMLVCFMISLFALCLCRTPKRVTGRAPI